MNENTITTKLIHALNTIPGCYAKKQHGGMFSSGEPDVNACYEGRALKIEVKVSGGCLSPLQAQQMQKWTNAGAIVLLAVYDYNTKLFSIHSSALWELFAGERLKANSSKALVDCKAESWKIVLNTFFL